MSRDPLADIIRSLRLSGGVFVEGDFRAPWAISSKISEEDCRPFIPVPKHVIAYHLVVEGRMLVRLNATEYEAQAGDIVFLPTNAWHTMSSDRGLRPILGDDLILPHTGDGLAKIELDGGGRRTRVLCGYIASETGLTPLLNSLPETLVVSTKDVATLNWLHVSIGMAARELNTRRVASATVVGRLSELLLIEALRAYVEREQSLTGWLAGMADPHISRALAFIHRDLCRPAKTETLAAEAGLSRSVFVRRFVDLLGMGPGRYAMTQRLALAEDLLRDTDLTISEIAYRSGYNAPEAFSRAFKRETGLAPADWQDSQTKRAGHHPA